MRKHLQPATFLATLALLCVAGCKTAPTPSATPTATPKPTLMDATARTSSIAKATQHPAFKVLLQKTDVPTILVVAEDTTDDQLTSLLWYLRIQTRDGKLKALGIHPTTVTFGTPSYSTGELNIYRGTRCASEMYTTSGPDPCGPSIHKSAAYHWGEGGDPRADSASIKRQSGSDDILFTNADGFQTDAEARTDPTGTLHKAARARIQYATTQNAKATKQHTDFRFAVTEPDTQLRIVSYQLATDEGRTSFLKQFLTLEQDHLCPLAFTSLQLGALGAPATTYPIPCNP